MTVAAVYERSSGGHVAERVRPVPGSEEEQRYEQLAAARKDGWRRVAELAPPAAPTDDPPKRPAQSASKADWVAWADRQDPGDHESMTKDQLIEQYGPKGDD